MGREPDRSKSWEEDGQKLEKVPEDDKTRAEKDIQKLTDEHIKQIDGLIHSKEAEIMDV